MTEVLDNTDATEGTLPDVDGEVVNDTAPEANTPAAAAPKAKRTRKAPAKAGAKAKAPAKGKAVAKAAPKPKPEPEKSTLTPAAARRLNEKLQKGLKNSAELLIEAYTARIWLALGHASWAEYLEAELGEYRVKLPVAERQQLVTQMTQNKMSTRAIAAGLGVDQKTVVNDRAELTKAGVLQVKSTRVTGEDGKDYSGTGTEKAVDPEKVAGKFVERVTSVFDKLDKFVGDLVELSADPLFEQEAGQIATRHRQDIARVVASLGVVSDRMQ